jgi:hypothetical protein
VLGELAHAGEVASRVDAARDRLRARIPPSED